MTDRPIAVIGGGISGLSAAVDLVDAGRRVVLLERRAFLGGRATSFPDRTTGQEIDNCQHVVLGCCTNVLDLLDRLGTRDRIDFRTHFHYVEPGGRRHLLRPHALPAPMHFLPSILRFGAVSFADRLRIVTRFLRMMTMGKPSLLLHGKRPMAELLSDQSETAIRRFWEPILVSAVNEDLDKVAALPCLQVFLQGFLPHRDAAAMGVPRVGLRSLYAEPARRYIEGHGGEVRLRANVTGLRHDGDRVDAVTLHDGEEIAVDGAVVAVPPANIGGLDPENTLAPAAAVPTSFASITGIHLWFDRVVVDLPRAVLLDSPIQWVFARDVDEASARELGARQYLNLVVSASHAFDRMSQSDVLALARRELAAAFPAAADAEAEIVHATVVKELGATISPTPEVEAARPATATRFENVALAGDWTDTSWPATLEGSTRSGRLAAAHVLGREPQLTPDLPRGLLARVLLSRVPRAWPSSRSH